MRFPKSFFKKKKLLFFFLKFIILNMQGLMTNTNELKVCKYVSTEVSTVFQLFQGGIFSC